MFREHITLQAAGKKKDAHDLKCIPGPFRGAVSPVLIPSIHHGLSGENACRGEWSPRGRWRKGLQIGGLESVIPPTETRLPREALSLWLTASGAEEGESWAHRWWRTVGGREGVSTTQPGQAPWEGGGIRRRGRRGQGPWGWALSRAPPLQMARLPESPSACSCVAPAPARRCCYRLCWTVSLGGPSRQGLRENHGRATSGINSNENSFSSSGLCSR